MSVAIASAECGVCHETREPATWCMDSEVGSYALCEGCNPRTSQTMTAVTIAVSGPADRPIDWTELLGGMARLALEGTEYSVIDHWRADA